MTHKLFVRCLTVTLLLALTQPAFAMRPEEWDPPNPQLEIPLIKFPSENFLFLFFVGSLLFLKRPPSEENQAIGNYPVLRLSNTEAPGEHFSMIPSELEEDLLYCFFSPQELYMTLRPVCRRWHELVFHIFDQPAYRDRYYISLFWIPYIQYSMRIFIPTSTRPLDLALARSLAIAQRNTEAPSVLISELTQVQRSFLQTGILNPLPLPAADDPWDSLSAILVEWMLWNEEVVNHTHSQLYNSLCEPLEGWTWTPFWNGVRHRFFRQVSEVNSQFQAIVSTLGWIDPEDPWGLRRGFVPESLAARENERLTEILKHLYAQFQCQISDQPYLMKFVKLFDLQAVCQDGTLTHVLEAGINYSFFIFQLEGIWIHDSADYLEVRADLTALLKEQLKKEEVQALLDAFKIPENPNPLTHTQFELLRRLLPKAP